MAGRSSLLRAEESEPLNAHLPDVHVSDDGTSIPEASPQAVIAPPVPLDQKAHIREPALEGWAVALPVSPHRDISSHPTYKSWASFFEKTGAPTDFAGEWDLAAAVTFWSPVDHYRSCGKDCVMAVVDVDPDGKSALSGESRLGSPKIKLEFSARTVGVSAMCMWDNPGICDIFELKNSTYSAGYAERSDSLVWESSQVMPPDHGKTMHWTCRMFQGGTPKLICARTIDGSRRFTDFLVFTRDDGKDLLEPLPAILKPFATPPSSAVTLERHRETN